MHFVVLGRWKKKSPLATTMIELTLLRTSETIWPNENARRMENFATRCFNRCQRLARWQLTKNLSNQIQWIPAE